MPMASFAGCWPDGFVSFQEVAQGLKCASCRKFLEAKAKSPLGHIPSCTIGKSSTKRHGVERLLEGFATHVLFRVHVPNSPRSLLQNFTAHPASEAKYCTLSLLGGSGRLSK